MGGTQSYDIKSILPTLPNEFLSKGTDKVHKEDVLNNDIIGIYFSAHWCGPCRVLGPIIEEIATDFEGKAVVGKVDVDNNQQVSVDYGIRNIPTVLIFKNGEVVDKIVGVAPKEQIAKKLSAHL